MQIIIIFILTLKLELSIILFADPLIGESRSFPALPKLSEPK